MSPTPGDRQYWSTFQNDVHEWVLRNFGSGHLVPTYGGLLEEVGEVARALVKRAQGVRGTREEWTAELKKELGDVVIKLMDTASEAGVDIYQAIAGNWMTAIPAKPETELETLTNLAFGVTRLMNIAAHAPDPHAMAHWVARILFCVDDLAEAEGWRTQEVAEERWAVVGARDFVTDTIGHGLPEAGG